MSDKTKFLEKTSFNLSLRAHKSAIAHWLRVILLAVAVAFAVLKLLQSAHAGLLLKVLAFVLFLAVLGVAGVLAQYLFRLRFSTENSLELNEEGLFDSASFCAVGFIPMAAIDQISFSTRYGAEFLVIKFTEGSRAYKRVGSFHRQIYRLVVGRDLWIPLGFFRMSRIDLESQIIHLDRLIRRDSRTSPPKVPERDKGKKDNAKTLPSEPKPRVVRGRDEVPVAEASSQPEIHPPPLSQVKPERNRVIERIEEIRRKVRESGFDQSVAQLYLDQIAFFPSWADSHKEMLPEGVRQVRGATQGTNYEEVSFHYAGLNLQFGLRRDIGASDEALLSVGVEGRVHMSLKVRVEIGELEPLELESFIAGRWQDELSRLTAQIEEAEARRLGVIEEATNPGSPTPGQTSTNIADLKNRFGLDD